MLVRNTFGIGKELVHNLSARFALQVQRDESLIQVAHIESEVLFVRHGHVEYRRLGYAQRITLGCLDFNDVGTPFRPIHDQSQALPYT